jgi:hypothetical protein
MPDGEPFIDLLRTVRAIPQVDVSSRPDDRLVICPECRSPIKERNRLDHLIAVHGYLAFAGTLLPRPAALKVLWDRAFNRGDLQAHEQLCVLLTDREAPRNGLSSYAISLQAELLRRFESSNPNRRDLIRWVQLFRRSEAGRPYYWELLTAADPRVRTLGREFLLPEVGTRLAEERTQAQDVRLWLDQLCPADDIWEKIKVCQRLNQYGAFLPAVKECLRHLQAERPVACQVCGVAVPQDQLEGHLRKEHRIFQFRGIQGTLEQNVAALLAALCGPHPEYEAWERLESLAQDEFHSRADLWLVRGLSGSLGRVDEDQLGDTANGLAEVLAGSERSARLAQLLAKSPAAGGRCLALALTARLRPPVRHSLIRAIRPLLHRRAAPLEQQIAAAAALLNTTGKTGNAAAKIIHALVQGCRKHRALERLRRLEEETGPFDTLTTQYAAIENRIRMRCNRCGLQLRRPEMARHLWSEHALLLYGRRVREPWRLVEEWVQEYQRDGQAELLARCRTLAQQLDPEEGLLHLYRLLLARKIEDVEARQVLLAEAQQRLGTLCPRCFALVPVPDEVLPGPLNRSHGRLSLNGYCVEVSTLGWTSTLTLETPRSVLYRGREPGQWLTVRAAGLLWAAPLVVTAFILAVGLPSGPAAPVWPVTFVLLLALAAYLSVYARAMGRSRTLDRALDHAWTLLAPRLHEEDFSAADSAFLASLAVTSSGRGKATLRADALQRSLRLTENAVAGRAAPLAHLTVLRRLELTDLVGLGRDPVPFSAAQVGRCFEGELPVAYAGALLAGWRTSWWTNDRLLRLRLLLCDRAFAAGMEVGDLVKAGKTLPALADILHLDYPEGVAQLRLLWSQRASEPWHLWTDPLLAFDIAGDAGQGGKLLEACPDLLVVDQGEPAIYVCGRGILFKGKLFTQPARRIEAKGLRDFDRVHYELLVDDQRFLLADDARSVVERLERAFRYFFGSFRPQVQGVLGWKSPERPALLRHEAVLCHGCRRLLLPRLGEVGKLLGEENAK